MYANKLYKVYLIFLISELFIEIMIIYVYACDYSIRRISSLLLSRCHEELYQSRFIALGQEALC